jgi:Response regulator receiver domain
MLSSASSPSAIAIGRSGHSPCGERRSSSAAIRSARRTRISRTLGILVYAQTLVQVFAWLLGERISMTSTGSERVADGPGNVLVVEDDEDQRQLMRAILGPRGWSVREAANGRLALDAITAELPDVILLDLMMPEMDGFEVVAALQAKQRGAPSRSSSSPRST